MMNKNKFRIPAILTVIIASMIGCTKQEIGPLMDIRPAVSVTVTNAVAFRPDPTVVTSKAAGGNIQIILSIPANSGRTIKEITKIAANTSYTAIQSTGTTGFYISAPIAVNSTTATFNTTLAEYVVKAPGVIPANTNTELARRFYFKLTLDDGTDIIPFPVRVLYLD